MARAAKGKRTILVVDDDADLRAMVCELLEVAGYRALGASDGASALRRLEGLRSDPDLILLDLRMPFLDGWDLVAELRRRGCSIPIGVQSSEEGAAPEGVDFVLRKPVNARQLLDRVEKSLE